ncbi:MAG: hypothetical protein AAB706_02905 [Patescibacteria group bacterium]
MQFLINTYKKTATLHHAYLIQGETEHIFPTLVEFFESHVGIKSKGNPDFWHATFGVLGVEEGRIIKERQSLTSFGGGLKVFIVSADSVTFEAQNALLKVFEEPTPKTHFFLILPSTEALLPTFLSRVFLYRYESNKESDFAKEFLKATPTARITLLAKMIEEKNRGEALSFLNGLEKTLRESKKELTKDDVFVFEEIIKCRGYLSDRSPSFKTILEYIALIVPSLK